MGQHVAGDRDLVVEREMLDHFEGGIVDRPQALAELGLGARLDAGDQQTEDVVKNLDLFVVEAIAIVQEQVGHLPKGFDPLRRRPGPDGIFEFGNN